MPPWRNLRRAAAPEYLDGELPLGTVDIELQDSYIAQYRLHRGAIQRDTNKGLPGVAQPRRKCIERRPLVLWQRSGGIRLYRRKSGCEMFGDGCRRSSSNGDQDAVTAGFKRTIPTSLSGALGTRMQLADDLVSNTS